jgi:hypothetical protein
MAPESSEYLSQCCVLRPPVSLIHPHFDVLLLNSRGLLGLGPLSLPQPGNFIASHPRKLQSSPCVFTISHRSRSFHASGPCLEKPRFALVGFSAPLLARSRSPDRYLSLKNICWFVGWQPARSGEFLFQL